MGLRYYDGRISRFLTADQFPGLVTEPVTHNLYIYCNNDPINNIDPTGQLAIGSWIKKATQTIKKGIQKAVKKTKQVVKKAVTTVKKVVKQTAKKAATTVKKAATTVKKAVKQVKKTVTTTVKTAVKTVSKAATKTYQQAKTTIKAAVETSKAATGKFITAVSENVSREQALDAVQTGLDIAGLIPVVGEIADGTNALIYALRGDMTNAALSAAACIPIAGWGAFGMKAVNKGVKALDKAGDVYDVARGTGKTFSPIDPHPTLPKNVQNSFSGGTFTEKVLIEDMTFYRVYGGEAKQVGSYMSRTPQNGGLQSQMDLALNPEWGNTAISVTKVTVPKGTVIYEGTAASQTINGGTGSLIGGGNQVYIPEVNPSWFGN